VGVYNVKEEVDVLYDGLPQELGFLTNSHCFLGVEIQNRHPLIDELSDAFLILLLRKTCIKIVIYRSIINLS
jgi:hypothetical protein